MERDTYSECISINCTNLIILALHYTINDTYWSYHFFLHRIRAVVFDIKLLLSFYCSINNHYRFRSVTRIIFNYLHFLYLTITLLAILGCVYR